MTIKTSEADILSCLSDIPQSQSDIARKAGINRSNVTGWLHKLEAKEQAKKTSNGQWILAETQQHCNTTTSVGINDFFEDFFRKYHPDIDPYTQLDLAFYTLIDDFQIRYLDVFEDDDKNSSMANHLLNVLECDEEDIDEYLQRLKDHMLRKCIRTKQQQHNNDYRTDKLKMALRHFQVHVDIRPDDETTGVLQKLISELKDCEDDSFDIKFNEFYDELHDIFNNRIGTNYAKIPIRDRYIELRDKYGYPLPNLREIPGGK
jgi:hypothetical protein